MKMKLIPAAILAALSMAGAAQAQVTVYGLIDAGFAHADGAEDALAYSNNSTTKIGFKGTTDLGSGFKVNFNLEAGGVTGARALDGGKAPALFNRQGWAGVAGGFGEIRVGTQDSVAFKHLIGFDLNGAANDTQSGFLLGANSIPVLGQNALPGGKELAQYISPVMGGLQATVGYTPRGDRDIVADPKAKTNYSLGVAYNAGGLSAAVAYESANTDDSTKLSSNSFTSLAASYDFKVAKITGILVNGGTTAAGLSGRGSSVGVSVPVAGATVGIQYAKNTDTSDTGTEIFANKEVLKNTIVYLDYGMKNPNGAAKTNLYSVGLIYVF